MSELTESKLNKESKIPGFIAISLVIFFGGILFVPLVTGITVPDEGRRLLETLLTIIVGFYFGSNYGSRRKTEIIASSVPKDITKTEVDNTFPEFKR